MGNVIEYRTLEHVAEQARPYPAQLLEGCETGLVLFAAAFLGHNDAIHFAEAGLVTTCVDVDRERLAEMKALYPSDWKFRTSDAWSFVKPLGDPEFERSVELAGGPWDAVSVDTFTGDPMFRSLKSLDLWCSLARKFVTVTITNQIRNPPTPKGWRESYYPRSHNVSWLVLER